MGFSYNGVAASVTVSGSVTTTQYPTLPQPYAAAALATQTMFSYGGQQAFANDTWVTFHTVTAGKTFYLTDVSVGGDTANRVHIGNNAGTVLYEFGMTNTYQTSGIHLKTPIAFAAGDKVQIKMMSAVNVSYGISGYEA
jgi:hypothetical protein